jgi:nucleotide-binding universal stress UspA family protein
MIKSALLALDGSSASRVAQDMAIQFVKYHHTGSEIVTTPISLTGIAVLDRPTIEALQPTPLGAGSFKAQRDEALIADANQRIAEFLHDFESACQAAGVAYEVVRTEGIPYQQIEDASRQHDLILIGKNTNFHFETTDETGETVKRLLQHNPRPVIVTSDDLPQGNNVLIAYDGSLQSARALQMWTLLGLGRKETILHVISIDPVLERAQRLCDEAAGFLRRHGKSPETHAINSQEHPTGILLAQAKALGVRMVVMGAFGHTGLRERFFGSATQKMLKQSPVPMFIYH